MISLLQWILGMLVAAILLYAIAMNAHIIPFHWNPADKPINLPVYVIIFAAFCLGFISALLHYGLSQISGHITSYKQKLDNAQRIETLTKELKQSQKNA